MKPLLTTILAATFIGASIPTIDAASPSTEKKLSVSPTTKEITRVKVEVLQVLSNNGGILCLTDNGTIFVEYTKDDLADGDIITIDVQRNGVYRYESAGGTAKSVGKYKWIPKAGQTKIYEGNTQPIFIDGKVVQVIDNKITIINFKKDKSYILINYPEVNDVIDGDEIMCKAQRIGAYSFINQKDIRTSLPVYKYISK